MKIVKVFYDLETTGVVYQKHSLHQIAGIIEVNGEVVETFDIKSAPHPKAEIDPVALNVCGVTEAQIKDYPDQGRSFRTFRRMIQKYVGKFDPTDKAYLVGFNNRAFDDLFLRRWFERNGDNYIGSLFWVDTLDVLVLASQYLIGRRPGMPSFKQSRVAAELGIAVDKDKLHDALYDVILTREIYRIVSGEEIEI